MNEKIGVLNGLGADTASGIMRCAGKEELYVMLVGKALADANFEKLAASVSGAETENAFQAAHALKGVLANLSLTPLADKVATVTETLRGGAIPSFDEISAIEALRAEFIEKLGL